MKPGSKTSEFRLIVACIALLYLGDVLRAVFSLISTGSAEFGLSEVTVTFLIGAPTLYAAMRAKAKAEAAKAEVA